MREGALSMILFQAVALFLAGLCLGALAFFVWAWMAMGGGE